MQVEERLRLETSAGLCRLCSWGSKSGRVGKRVACECHELASPTILVVEHVALESGEAVRSVWLQPVPCLCYSLIGTQYHLVWGDPTGDH